MSATAEMRMDLKYWGLEIRGCSIRRKLLGRPWLFFEDPLLFVGVVDVDRIGFFIDILHVILERELLEGNGRGHVRLAESRRAWATVLYSFGTGNKLINIHLKPFKFH